MRADEAVKWLQDRIADGRLRPDEPVFPLVAHDWLAGAAVIGWASTARAIGVPEDRCRAAETCAHAMQAWPEHHVPGTKRKSWEPEKKK